MVYSLEILGGYPMNLIKPSIEYLTSYIEFAKQLEKEGNKERFSLDEAKKDPNAYIENMKILETENCKTIMSYLVPTTILWLIEDNNEVIGRLSIRHNLRNDFLKKFGGHIGYAVKPEYRKQGIGTYLLTEGLKFVEKIAIPEVLITCDEVNIPSRKIIEQGGGKYINKIYNEGSKVDKLRYKIII